MTGDRGMKWKERERRSSQPASVKQIQYLLQSTSPNTQSVAHKASLNLVLNWTTWFTTSQLIWGAFISHYLTLLTAENTQTGKLWLTWPHATTLWFSSCHVTVKAQKFLDFYSPGHYQECSAAMHAVTMRGGCLDRLADSLKCLFA